MAAKFGTPLYVYGAAAIRERYRLLDSAFAARPHTVCYAVKANSNLSILKLLAAEGAGFDIVSGGELDRVRVAAPDALGRVVFSGVGKTAAEMDAALAAGILLFHVESEGELALLAARARAAKTRARVSLRVNPDVFADTHPYISTGLREHKFGVSVRDARRLYRSLQGNRWLTASGISVHIGSQIRSAAPFADAARRARELFDELRAEGLPLKYLDAGGGLGIEYDARKPFGATAKATEYAKAVHGAAGDGSAHLLLEPGRFIVAQAGALLTRVLYVKRNGRKTFVITDAGMNDLIRPALYGAKHSIVPVKPRPGAMRTVDVVGPVCETGDFFARDTRLPPVEPGDLLAILDAGAYGMSLASNYNSRGRAAEVLVEGSRLVVIGKRETTSELIALEN